MAGPPPYGPRKRSNTTTIVFIVLGVCAVCCILGVGATAFFGYWGYKNAKSSVACGLGFAEAAKAMEDYADAHGGKLPPADKWQDEIRPYFAKRLAKDEEQGAKIFGSFDPNGVWTCKDDAGKTPDTGIAFNTDLSGLKLSDIKNKTGTYILFEVPKTGMNLNIPYTDLNESESPKVMGKPRGWYRVNGNFEASSSNGGSNFNFKD
jgi:hypothetical protein